MAGKVRKEIVLAQNFLYKPNLVRKLVGMSSIGPEDIVYEIGAGGGILTEELARTGCRIVALEIDRSLVRGLRERFHHHPRIRILQADFLDFRIRDRRYKIFANIPFNRTARIVRKLLSADPVPLDAYLIVQKEAAEKFTGVPEETRFSLLVKPWFRIRVLHRLHRTDFRPAPHVDAVLLHIQWRNPPLVRRRDAELYREFITFGFAGWKRNLKTTYRRVFSHRRWKKLAKSLGFPLHATPTELTFRQWMGLFADCKRQLFSERTAGRGGKSSRSTDANAPSASARRRIR